MPAYKAALGRRSRGKSQRQRDSLPPSVRTADPTRDLGVEETILIGLVALNAERAAEERRGLVRWLRPDFQNPGGAGTVQAEADLATVTQPPPVPAPLGPRPCPSRFRPCARP